jgi:UPF0755 protein
MFHKKAIYLNAAIILVAGFFVVWFSREFFSISIHPKEEKAVLLIPDNASWIQVMDSIMAHLDLRNQKVFQYLASKKGYPQRIKAGRYVISKSLSCNQLINILRSGRQSPVIITFNNVRTLNDLAGKVGGRIEADSSELADFLEDTLNYEKDGFDKRNIISVFIPDSYEFLWNTNAEGFYRRMLREYRRFWNSDRMEKAKELNLTPREVSTLASIVDEEVIRPDEKPRIAGVYINRLRRGIPLQADPTVKFAVNNFTISRVLNKHLAVDSPYNTYKYQGLPPGPINCPSIEDIEAVLNAEKHDYLFFVAKPDLSGYHNFSRTLSEHNRYAHEYQRELNRRRIFR